MNIVEVDISALRGGARRGRRRSPETLELVRTIGQLRSGSAKAILLEPGETSEGTRARLAYAARVAGKKLDIAVKEDRILFALRRKPRRRAGRPRKLS